MTIKELIVNIPVIEINGNVDQEVTSIHFDSRKVVPGSVFVAVKGRATDGHKFIDIAIDRGALCIVTQAASTNAQPPTVFQIDNREEGGQEKSEVSGHERREVCEIIVEDSAS